MDFTVSALTGAARVGVQVIVSQKQPVLEIYQDIRNEFAPPFDIEHRNSTNTKVIRVDKHRFQEISISFTSVNIGGSRAENVHFELSGKFQRHEPRQEWPRTFQAVIRQLAPGQALHLMQLQTHDLEEYEYEEQANGLKVGKSIRNKTDTLTIAMHYDGPDTWWNRIFRWPRRLQGLKQFSSSFTFDPMVLQELPPPKYNG
ncbi:hypothetical protein SAMN06297251_101221 [Fulvimarina manganoxydans]|uniref:Uncharacterized protein n=1 Tax=Fulvimarina manganoxydans TaxID=937218 RepID=A0A1W1YES2_9HYPH|nr:hypothetical protein [Fulvimarina manganoxydans]SMC34642.1 hypothetical protein SAMN06297251_101221 [Fulvimarina manganoxydans]